jgi:2-polyprenyl-3-methyl-5-hydroxy-6-metoxy-1,4-benzoquinol methylase
MFRFPKENVTNSLEFYQKSYQEGLTTSLPDDKELENLLSQKFKGTPKDFSGKVDLIRQYKPEGKLLDYGCSWGYGVWQLQKAGYKALGFEISRPRAKYGREKLGVDILDCADDLNNLPGAYFDVIFSSHVLEHLPDISDVFPLLHRLLKPGGMLAIFVPNCDGCDMKEGFEEKKSFAFGEKHTIAFSSSFLKVHLPNHGFKILALEGITTFGFPELMVFAEKF